MPATSSSYCATECANRTCRCISFCCTDSQPCSLMACHGSGLVDVAEHLCRVYRCFSVFTSCHHGHLQHHKQPLLMVQSHLPLRL
jgi:hypothetical protein